MAAIRTQGAPNVFAYIESLAEKEGRADHHPSTIGQLYENHWACRRIFESLPDLAKQYVLRMSAAGPNEWVQMKKRCPTQSGAPAE